MTELIGEVINNLNVVIGSLSDQRQQFRQGHRFPVANSSTDWPKRKNRRGANSVAYHKTLAAPPAWAELDATDAGPRLHGPDQSEPNRTSSLINADRDFTLTTLLATLPDSYRIP